MNTDSPFLDVPSSDWLASNRSAFAISDIHPVSPGHSLVISRRLIRSWWEAYPDEQADLVALVGDVKTLLDSQFSPDGYNVGFNVGAAAGQTIFHLHIHIIPRYSGDSEHPEGGIRHVFPEKANYLVPRLDRKRSPATERSLLDSLDGRYLHAELVRALRDPTHDRVDLVVSFVMPSGVDLVLADLHEALVRGARLRLLTTGYMGVTSPDALLRLLDLAAASPIIDRGEFTVRAFEGDGVSFHPKGYLLWNSLTGSGQLFVGSGNLSRSGLAGGVEWTLHTRDIGDAVQSFERLWNDPRSRAVDDQWVAEYRDHRELIVDLTLIDEPLSEDDGSWTGHPHHRGLHDDDAPQAHEPSPTPIQGEALEALEETRADGHQAGLVVMATGLGKTWLAAFDSNRAQFPRILFVAHRVEILLQARNVFRRLRPSARLGFFVGSERHPDAEVVFATVQTLHQNLHLFLRDSFQYIVVDEFHHAEAATYRAVLDHFAPEFLLGLTATPERMDGADLLSLCGDNLVFRCDLVEGIVRNELVPFRYWGIPDTVDFTPIPWRGGRFVVSDLERELATEERADAALREWSSRAGARTLGFCCSITHADYMAEHFLHSGIPAASLHSRSPVGWRQEAVEKLTTGELRVLFTVDLFNEGVDLPEVDTVLFLRPTESPVVFLQQLGRGLRISPNKEHLSIVDFIGNHRSFLTPLRTLLSLDLGHHPSDREIALALESLNFGLPAGCSIDYSLEAVEMLHRLLTVRPLQGIDLLRDLCFQLYDEDGFRPTALQLTLAGGTIVPLRGDWFGFLREISILAPEEEAVVSVAEEVLKSIATTSMTKSFKMVALRAMLREGALNSGMYIRLLASRSMELVRSDPRLLADVDSNRFPSLDDTSPRDWEEYWQVNPIAAWARSSIFRLDADRLVPTFSIPANLESTFDAMVAELVEWRLHLYFRRRENHVGGDIVLRVSHSSGKPIIRFDRSRTPELPSGEVPFVADGKLYTGRFVQIALNVATLPGSDENVLPKLLRAWFGPSAGHPGSDHRVKLRRLGDHWEMTPARDSSSAEGSHYPWFTSPREAVTVLRESDDLTSPRSRLLVNLPPVDEGDFVLTADEELSLGGTTVERGDLLLMRRSGPGAARLRSDLFLVDSADPAQPTLMRSPAPDGRAPSGTPVPIAGLLARVDPASHMPIGRWIGHDFRRDAVPGLFGLTYNPGNWQSGHVSLTDSSVLFVTLTKDADRVGSDYIDRFESESRFHWTSQNSVGPADKKGRDVLNAIEEGRDIHLFVRTRRTEVSFAYCGLVVPERHDGAKPMTVWFRLLDPLSPQLKRQFKVE